jgi:hypothetical protein
MAASTSVEGGNLMDLASLFRLCRRHLVVLFLAGALGAAFVAMVVVTAPPVYRATGSNVLLPPLPEPDKSETTETESANVWVRMDDLSLAVDIVERRMQSALRASGFGGEWKVTGNSVDRRGPILDLVATGSTDTEALDRLDVLIEQQATVLSDMQVGSPELELITATIVVAPNAVSRTTEAGSVVYDASSTVLLVAPTALAAVPVPVEQTANPYFRLNDMSVVVDIVKRVMVGPDLEQRVRADGLTGTYIVAANTDFYRGPIVDMVVETDDPDKAVEGVKILLREQATMLDQLQASEGTEPDYRITTQVVIEPAEASRVLTSTMRRGMAAAILAGGFVLTLLLLADVASRMRATAKRRRASRASRTKTNTESNTAESADDAGASGQPILTAVADDLSYFDVDRDLAAGSRTADGEVERVESESDDDRADARSTVGS